jgi:signal transduction histidine kinase
LIEGSLRTALNELFYLMASGTSLQVDFVVAGEPYAVSPAIEETLLHIAQEALTNTIKHAEARLFVATLRYEADALWLRMVDDGRGFDRSAEANGYGLIGMAERVEEVGGRLAVRSRPGEGTELEIVLPETRLDAKHQECPNAG